MELLVVQVFEALAVVALAVVVLVEILVMEPLVVEVAELGRSNARGGAVVDPLVRYDKRRL